jgi:hypothetical protein
MLLNINVTRVGSEEQYDPRKAGEILRELFPNTEPCVDVKFLTLKNGRLEVGTTLHGIITRDGEEHFTFRETQPSTAGKRNPREFNGKYITITRRDDGTLHPNFKALKNDKGFDVARYATGVANELLWALTSLLGKKGSKK